MSAHKEFSLQQLLQIALGYTKLSKVNTSVLHSLFNIIIMKLECENEVVTVSGAEAQCLNDLLKKSKPAPLNFDVQNIDLIWTRLEKVNKLDENVNQLNDRLNKHFEEMATMAKNSKHNEKEEANQGTFEEVLGKITKVALAPQNLNNQMENSPPNNFLDNSWQPICLTCEHLCTLAHPEHEMGCQLLKNKDFMEKLLKRLSNPMIKRALLLEERTNELDKEFQKFLKTMEEQKAKINVLSQCVIAIENLRTKITSNYNSFLVTLEELQILMQGKLGKVHIPPFKKYIHDRFEAIDRRITAVEKLRSLPTAAGVAFECQDCGSRTIARGEVQPEEIWAERLPKKTKPLVKKHCSHKQWLVEQRNKIKPKTKTVICSVDPYKPVELIVGTDNAYYRKDMMHSSHYELNH